MKQKILFFLGVFSSAFGLAQNVTPNFSSSGACGSQCLADMSTSTNGPIVSWNWSFPGGSPATATTQTVCVTFPPGNYTASLTVTNSNGDVGTISKAIAVGGFPTASIIPTTPCLGQATTLTNGSVAVSGDPIVSWSWSMPGGNPGSATTANTSTFYSTAGTHNVTLIVTSQQGCKDTIVQQVIVYHLPVANFSAGPLAGAMAFTDLSTSQDGPVISWNWLFFGGTPSSSSLNNPSNIVFPPGTYSVCLTVTSTYGCVDSSCQSITVMGVDENNLSSSVTISPSISSAGLFSISVLSPQVDVEELEIYDMLGNRVLRLSGSQALFSFDLSQAGSGIYFVRINTAVGTLTKKVVLSK